MGPFLQLVFESVLLGRNDSIESAVRGAMESGVAPAMILNDGLIAAMTEVGRLYETGEYYVPEMLVAARAMQFGLAILKPHLEAGDTEATGKVIIGAVKGDLHDIGKSLVGMMLEGAGFEVVDLGTDVPPTKFADAARTLGADIVAVSALLTTTMQNMRDVIVALEDMGVRKQVKVMVGGAPVTDAFAMEIGADGYGRDAGAAVRLASALMREQAK
jgi:5-methyltetrahydrofolate--homocysteine methyltransferase